MMNTTTRWNNNAFRQQKGILAACPMSSTSSIITRTGFYFVKKRKNTPWWEFDFLKTLILYYCLLTHSHSLLSLLCHITICLIAFFNGWITSAVYPEFSRWYRTHPPSPTFIVSSRTNRDCIPWTIILQLFQILWDLFLLLKFTCQKLKEYMLHSDSIAYVLHIGYVSIHSTGHPGFGFRHSF